MLKRKRKEESDAEPDVIALVEELLQLAFEHRASDIHLEPGEHEARTRMRVDGVLRSVSTIERDLFPKLVRRIKVMAELDHTESRRGQDGRARLELAHHQVNLRVSVLPSMYGEKVVIRLLDGHRNALSLDELGFSSHDRERFGHLVEANQGAILVTGPTGSGKSSTLFAVLDTLNTDNRSIVTIEDPVETVLPGLTQVQINRVHGVGYADILRSILRQDPDVIMVGEIRDQETAESAFRAAQTGHLLLSTLHTNSAAATITRLRYMGLPMYLLTAAIRGIVAQRLVPCVCRHCARDEKLDSGQRKMLQASSRFEIPKSVKKGAGCEHCSETGFLGRVAIFEVLPVTARIKELMFQEESTAAIEAAARSEGMTTLLEDAVVKMKAGLIAPEDALRYITSEPTESGLVCPDCQASLDASYRFCPFCTEGSQTTCGNCGSLTRPGWRSCAFCGFSLCLPGAPSRKPVNKAVERARHGLNPQT